MMMTSRESVVPSHGKQKCKKNYIKTHNKSRRPLRGGLSRFERDDGRGERRVSGSGGEHYFCKVCVGVKCALE
jgi:hypothetical protein